MKKSTLMKDSNSALECIERKAGCKSVEVPRSTQERIEKAAKIAQKRIEYNENIYRQSYIETRDIKYLSKRK